ncbi:MAG: hypothetical protein ACHP6I_01455 [Rickettsiales bacterium]
MKESFEAIANSPFGALPLDQVQLILDQKITNHEERIKLIQASLDKYKQATAPNFKSFYENQIKAQVNALRIALESNKEATTESKNNYKFLTKAFQEYITQTYGLILESAVECYGLDQFNSLLVKAGARPESFIKKLLKLKVPSDMELGTANTTASAILTLHALATGNFNSFPLADVERFTDIHGVNDIAVLIKETSRFTVNFIMQKHQELSKAEYEELKRVKNKNVTVNTTANDDYSEEFLEDDVVDSAAGLYDCAEVALLTHVFRNKFEDFIRTPTQAKETELCAMLQRPDNTYVINIAMQVYDHNILRAIEKKRTTHPKLYIAICNYLTEDLLEKGDYGQLDIHSVLLDDLPSYWGYLVNNAKTEEKKKLFDLTLIEYKEFRKLKKLGYTNEENHLIATLVAHIISRYDKDAADFILLLVIKQLKASRLCLVLTGDKALELLILAPTYFSNICTFLPPKMIVYITAADKLIAASNEGIDFNKIEQGYNRNPYSFSNIVSYLISVERTSQIICAPIRTQMGTLNIKPGERGTVDINTVTALLFNPRSFQYINFDYRIGDGNSLFTAMLKLFANDMDNKIKLIQLVADQFTCVKSEVVVSAHANLVATYLIAAKNIGSDELNDAVRKLTYNKGCLKDIQELTDTEIQSLFCSEMLHLYRNGCLVSHVKSVYDAKGSNVQATIDYFATPIRSESKYKRNHILFDEEPKFKRTHITFDEDSHQGQQPIPDLGYGF